MYDKKATQKKKYLSQNFEILLFITTLIFFSDCRKGNAIKGRNVLICQFKNGSAVNKTILYKTKTIISKMSICMIILTNYLW